MVVSVRFDRIKRFKSVTFERFGNGYLQLRMLTLVGGSRFLTIKDKSV